MKKAYFLLLILLSNFSLNAMKRSYTGETLKNFNIICFPDEITKEIIFFSCNWPEKYNFCEEPKNHIAIKNSLTTATNTITSLRCTNKRFKALLSDENVIKILHMDHANKEDLDGLLFQCINQANTLFTSFAIQLGADVNHYDIEFETTPLLLATGLNNYPICELLLDNRANVDGDNLPKNQSFGPTLYYPIHVAIKNNNLKMVQLFIEAKANPRIYTSINNSFVTPCFMAIEQENVEILQLLLPHLTTDNINLRCHRGDHRYLFPLTLAKEKKNEKIISLLEDKLRKS